MYLFFLSEEEDVVWLLEFQHDKVSAFATQLWKQVGQHFPVYYI